MPSEDNKILPLSQYQKSDKSLFIISPDPECLIEKIHRCKSNPKYLSATKVSHHIASDFSVSTKSSFKSIENKHDVYRSKDSMKTFCKSLRKHAMEIINFKKMKLLTKEQQESYENAQIFYN